MISQLISNPATLHQAWYSTLYTDLYLLHIFRTSTRYPISVRYGKIFHFRDTLPGTGSYSRMTGGCPAINLQDIYQCLAGLWTISPSILQISWEYHRISSGAPLIVDQISFEFWLKILSGICDWRQRYLQMCERCNQTCRTLLMPGIERYLLSGNL